MSKKISLEIITAIILIIATTAAAAATDINITAQFGDWMRLQPDLMVYQCSNDELCYYGSAGLIKTINISPYNSTDMLEYATYDNTYTGDIYWICDDTEKTLCIVDYSTETVNTINASPAYDSIDATLGTISNFRIRAVTEDQYVFTVSNGGEYNTASYNFNKTNLNNKITQFQFCHEDLSSRCDRIQYRTFGGNSYIYEAENQYSTSPSFAALYAQRFRVNGTTITQINSTFTQTGTPWYSFGNVILGSSADGNTLYVDGSYADSGILIDMEEETVIIPFPAGGLYTETFESEWYDYNGDDQSLVILYPTREILYFEGTSLVGNYSGIVSAYDYGAYALQNNAVLYPINSTTYRLTDNITSNESLVNSPPTIESYTVSTVVPKINQTVNIEVIEGNVEPEDVIHFGYKCEGTGNYTDTLIGLFTCTYDTAGTYTLTIAVSDNFHVGEWYDETNITITVSDEIYDGGIIRVQVLDDNNNTYIYNATVYANNKSTTTNTYGLATIYTDDDIVYEVTTSKTGYFTDESNLEASGAINIIRLEPLASEGTTNLLVTIKDKNTLLSLEDALTSFTNTITYQYDYGFTNANGQIFFNDIDTGTVIVQVSATDYEDGSQSVNIIEGSTNEVTILIGKTSGYQPLRADRNCTDDGLWICGDESIVQTSCTTDEECPLTNHCVAGINECSRFNYSRCDDEGLARDRKCVRKLSGAQQMNNLSNWFLTHIVWIIIIITLLVLIGFIITSFSN